MWVRCYAEGQDDRWEAICLDFDLAVQGSSFDEARRRMRESIIAYLEYVDDLPENEREAFLKRRAPLRIRLRFAWQVLRVVLSFRRGDPGDHHKDRAQFDIACPA